MAYWLLKSEPNDWSWAEQVAKGRQGAEWTGIRNFSAQNHLRAMKKVRRSSTITARARDRGIAKVIAEATRLDRSCLARHRRRAVNRPDAGRPDRWRWRASTAGPTMPLSVRR
jgi:predicted RNA-binding protein with PUA-like domain